MNDSIETQRQYGPILWVNPQKDMPHPHQPIFALVNNAETVDIMKTVAIVLAVAYALFLLENSVTAQKYKEEFGMDMDTIINDENKVKTFVDCILQDMCSGYGNRLKDMLLEALNNDCSTCTETQQGLISKAANYFMKEKPEIWQKIAQKYDPQGKHIDSFKKYIQEG